MKQWPILAILALSLLTFSCKSTSQAVIPTSKTLPSTEDNYTIIWVGQGKSFAYVDGEYQRSESNDYAFEVVQRRYDHTWKSVKNMHRIHPEYDGKAGAREQTLYFEIDFSEKGEEIISELRSSLGDGSGTSDAEFREQQFQLAVKDISSLAPYNTIRITQHYRYKQGELLETVELFKLEDGVETPFVKIEERAVIFRPTKLEEAPTVW